MKTGIFLTFCTLSNATKYDDEMTTTMIEGDVDDDDDDSDDDDDDEDSDDDDDDDDG